MIPPPPLPLFYVYSGHTFSRMQETFRSLASLSPSIFLCHFVLVYGRTWPSLQYKRSPCPFLLRFLAQSDQQAVEASWNVMAHAQKPDFVFRRNGRVHLNRRWASVQSTTGSQVVRISGSNAGHTMFRGSVKGTGYPLHSPVSPSLPLPCVTVCHHISTGVY